MLFNQRQIIEQAKFKYSPLGKAFGKQSNTIEDQKIKQIEALKALKPKENLKALKPGENQELESIKGLFPKSMRTDEIKNEIDEIRKHEGKIERKDLKYKTNKYIYHFQKFEIIRSFVDYTGKICTDEAEMDQTNLLKNMAKFNNKSRPRSKTKKENTFDSVNALYEGRELTLNAFRSEIFPIKATQVERRPSMLASRPSDLATRLKILISKQMLQGLPIAFAQVKASNISENLLNEIRQIMYSLYRAKEITKKVYNNIMNSIKL